MSATPAFSVGDHVTPTAVTSPATGIVIAAHTDGRFTVEWQTDYLTEVVSEADIEKQGG